MDQFARTQLLLGKAGIERLHGSRVAIFGVGGVGGFAAEALVRSGVGAVELFDDDRICLTNLNRQIIALRSTIGQYKVDVMAAPLARVMRAECRKRHIKGLKVAFSTEPPVSTDETEDISCRTHCVCPPGTARKCTIRRDIPGSTAFVPSSMGLLIASEVVRDLTRNSK